MLQSKLFIKTSKQAPADADSPNAKFLSQGGFIAKEMAGVYTYLPLGLRVLNNIQNIIREEMNALGAQELLMPAMSMLDRWKVTGRDSMDVLFKMKGAGDSELALNPTHEEILTPLLKHHISSYKDLPVFLYQIQDKFRNEPRAKSGILRGREFSMKDLYSFHTTQEDLDEFYPKAAGAYHRIYDRLGIGDITLYTYASGGDFSKYSHEFQMLADVGEDTIYVCAKCDIAINKEIINENDACPQCGEKDLEEKKAIEVGNIFKLGTRFSEAVDLTFTDERGDTHPVIMASYGIGPSRIMGSLVEVFHDDKGIIWPDAVAPFTAHLIGLDLDDETIKQKADSVYAELNKAGIEVLYDDRTDARPGEKFGDSDLIGIPWRLVVSKRSGDQVEVKRRDAGKAEMLDMKAAVKKVAS